MTSPAQAVPAPTALGHRRRHRLRSPLLLAAAVGALTVRVWAVDPNLPGHYPLCPTFALAGIYCPGCGTLRAAHALLHGDILGSFAMNVLFPPAIVLAAVLFVRWVVARWHGRELRLAAPTWVPWALLAGVTAFTVARNIPAFAFLAP